MYLFTGYEQLVTCQALLILKQFARKNSLNLKAQNRINLIKERSEHNSMGEVLERPLKCKILSSVFAVGVTPSTNKDRPCPKHQINLRIGCVQ